MPVLAVLTVVGGSCLVTVPAADAATSTASAVVVDGVELRYRAAPGQVNRVTVTSTFVDDYTVRYTVDDRVPIKARSGCTHPDPNDRTRVTCDAGETRSSGGPNVKVWLGDRNDRLRLNAFGSGYNDDPNGAVGYGGTGSDTLIGGSNRVRLFGNGGRDVLRGGTANDYLDGGRGPDTLYGGRSGDHLRGRSGNDVLHGNSSNDRLYGGRGRDKLYGGPGKDTLNGGPGRDVLRQN